MDNFLTPSPSSSAYVIYEWSLRTFNTELDYWKQPDSQFKYYVACSAILFIILAVVQISLIPM